MEIYLPTCRQKCAQLKESAASRAPSILDERGKNSDSYVGYLDVPLTCAVVPGF